MHPEGVDEHAVAPAADSFARVLGSTATLTCHMGYEIVPEGDLITTCVEHTEVEGSWSATSACQCKNIHSVAFFVQNLVKLIIFHLNSFSGITKIIFASF